MRGIFNEIYTVTFVVEVLITGAIPFICGNIRELCGLFFLIRVVAKGDVQGLLKVTYSPYENEGCLLLHFSQIKIYRYTVYIIQKAF
jgi:hypothetical protein